ncbi:MAG: hypothetical protein JXA69_20550 [Phycisphaerae bacterium]|nr:hypothetical protein [Phycisphaerae bacterium]
MATHTGPAINKFRRHLVRYAPVSVLAAVTAAGWWLYLVLWPVGWIDQLLFEAPDAVLATTAVLADWHIASSIATDASTPTSQDVRYQRTGIAALPFHTIEFTQETSDWQDLQHDFRLVSTQIQIRTWNAALAIVLTFAAEACIGYLWLRHTHPVQMPAESGAADATSSAGNAGPFTIE